VGQDKEAPDSNSRERWACAEPFSFILHGLDFRLKDHTSFFIAVIVMMHSGMRKITTNIYRKPGKLLFVSLLNINPFYI